MKNLMLILTVVSLFAGVGSAAVQEPETQGKIFPYDYQIRDLPNGLRVIVVPTDYPNIVSLQVPMQVGSRNEVESGKTGFAHFFEHMMFRGTEKYPAEQYNAILKNAGADQNAYTTDDYTDYHITFSKEDLETVLKLEADRFKNLNYSVEDFKTEARAVLGEYNKNSANPVGQLIEAQREAAFRTHTYRHTTMGFIQDIEMMPEQYDYSLQFFDRYYRPEYATVLLVGDLDPQRTFQLVEKYWGDWKAGDYRASIPAEPSADEEVYAHRKWATPTLPWVLVAFRGPAFSEEHKDMTAMDLVQSYAFSSSSPLFQKLVVQEQKVDQMFPYFPDAKDPYLVSVAARVKDPADVWYVRDEILKTFASMRTELIPAQELAEIKGNLKYSFANGMDNSEAIANALVGYLARTRDPETINRVYSLYDSLTSEDIREMSNRYFVDQGLVVTTLSYEDLPETSKPTGSIEDWLATPDLPEVRSILSRSSSPIVNFRLVFNTGSASDPRGKEGLAALTAAVVTGSGSKSMSYEDIQKAFFPIAAGFGSQVDKELTVFRGTTHRDNLARYHEVALGQLLEPGWDPDDFNRVKTNLINYVKVNLRGNNDEELGKEALYEFIYQGHPYGHLTEGHVASLQALTLEDVQQFHADHYSRANLLVGLAGGFSDGYWNLLRRDLQKLPEGARQELTLPAPKPIEGLEALLIQKETRATAISFGFPIDVNRSHPDFPALWLVRSYFGEHRSTNSHLFQRIREIRGMNYGDYAYIEYFPAGMFQFHPDPNLARAQQIFQVWIRPVVPVNAHFALRTAIFELDKLVREGMNEEDFEATRNFLVKFVNILTKTQDRELGYRIDSSYYGIPEFNQYIRDSLERLTLADVNRAIRTHLQTENMKIVIVAPNAAELRGKLIANDVSPIQYDAPKPEEILAEDRIIERLELRFRPESVRVVPVDQIFAGSRDSTTSGSRNRD